MVCLNAARSVANPLEVIAHPTPGIANDFGAEHDAPAITVDKGRNDDRPHGQRPIRLTGPYPNLAHRNDRWRPSHGRGNDSFRPLTAD